MPQNCHSRMFLAGIYNERAIWIPDKGIRVWQKRYVQKTNRTALINYEKIIIMFISILNLYFWNFYFHKNGKLSCCINSFHKDFWISEELEYIPLWLIAILPFLSKQYELVYQDLWQFFSSNIYFYIYSIFIGILS